MRGRPKGTTKNLREDPDRYAVALAELLRDAGAEEQVAFRFVVAAFTWRPLGVELLHDNKTSTSMLKTTYERPQHATALESRVSTFKKKAKRAATIEEDAWWLAQMKSAWSITLFMSRLDRASRCRMALAICDTIAERSFAESRLFPMIMQGGPGANNIPRL